MTTTPTLRMVNLGCGHRHHPDWLNIDMVSTGPGVIAHDLSKGIPFADASVDVVYHAAMLEHLRPEDALYLMTESHRVLKKSGIVRIGTPDLEQLCKLYLAALSAALEGQPGARHDYEWVMLELLDQFVRETSGGRMKEYLYQDPLPNEAFISSRIGEHARKVLRAKRAAASVPMRKNHLTRWRERTARIPGSVSGWVLRTLYGHNAVKALEIGRLRLGGALHHWMYDRYSLAQFMKETGFCNPQVVSAAESHVQGWARFNLDTLPDGTVIKPDLFFMEAVKP